MGREGKYSRSVLDASCCFTHSRGHVSKRLHCEVQSKARNKQKRGGVLFLLMPVGEYPPACPPGLEIPFPSVMGIYFLTAVLAAALAVVCVRSYFKSIRIVGIKLRSTQFSVTAWVIYFACISLEYVFIH